MAVTVAVRVEAMVCGWEERFERCEEPRYLYNDLKVGRVCMSYSMDIIVSRNDQKGGYTTLGRCSDMGRWVWTIYVLAGFVVHSLFCLYCRH